MSSNSFENETRVLDDTRVLKDDELDAVNGGVGLVASGAFLVICLAAGLAVGYYLNHANASSGAGPGDYPTGSKNTATA